MGLCPCAISRLAGDCLRTWVLTSSRTVIKPWEQLSRVKWYFSNNIKLTHTGKEKSPSNFRQPRPVGEVLKSKTMTSDLRLHTHTRSDVHTHTHGETAVERLDRFKVLIAEQSLCPHWRSSHSLSLTHSTRTYACTRLHYDLIRTCPVFAANLNCDGVTYRPVYVIQKYIRLRISSWYGPVLHPWGILKPPISCRNKRQGPGFSR